MPSVALNGLDRRGRAEAEYIELTRILAEIRGRRDQIFGVIYGWVAEARRDADGMTAHRHER